MADVEDRVDRVEAVARRGATVAAEGFDGVEAETKGGATRVVDPGDVVTAADRAAQRAVREAVRERFPSDAFVGEEADARERVPDDGVAWVVDPIDGTYNFVRGLPTWTTAVGLVVDGRTVAAATVAPGLGDAYAATGEATTLNGRPVTVSDRTAPETFAAAYTVVPPFGARGAYAAGVAGMFERFGEVRRVGSLQLVLALVAAGVLEGVVTSEAVRPWDGVGGVHLVRTAGGVVTDLDGDRWTRDATGLVASNGAAHGAFLDVGRRMAGRD